MKIAICFGTRPEIIKLALLSEKLSKTHEVTNIFTGQHHSLFEDVKHLIKIDKRIYLPEYTSMPPMYADITRSISLLFDRIKPDLVIVQGDTASAYCAALSAFLLNIRVGHVEAGLRTNDLLSPFPEELNRQVIDKISYYNWCPSELAKDNLIKENINSKIIVTGNTIVDFINNITDVNTVSYDNRIIVTLHRRENKVLFKDMLLQIEDIAYKRPDLEFIFPAHPNPNIQKCLNVLTQKNIDVRMPMKYEDFIMVLKNCRAIITDSGGIQEEALCFKKRVLICRDKTERNEGISIGVCKLVGNNIKDNFAWLLAEKPNNFINPYGDGTSCDKIIESLKGF